MTKRVKKKDKQNTNQINGNKITGNNTLKNNTGRPMPMTPKAGVTLKRRRYSLGGYYGK